MKLKKKFITLTSSERLYQYDKPMVALTGGIATGKSTVTKLLKDKGLQIIDADQLVKSIYQEIETKEFIQNNFPTVWDHDEINFKLLRELVFSDAKVKEEVETWIYQRLPAAFHMAALKIKNQDFYFYDVPLLFERGLDTKVDLTLLVYAPRKIQLARVIDRDESKQETAIKILDSQIDIEEKKEKADFVIDNSGSMIELAAEIDQLLLQILE